MNRAIYDKPIVELLELRAGLPLLESLSAYVFLDDYLDGGLLEEMETVEGIDPW